MNKNLNSPHMRDGDCYYCNLPTSSIAGNPAQWPLWFCHADDPGVTKAHHTGCVTARLNRVEKLEKGLKPFAKFGKRLMDGRRGIPKTGAWFGLDCGEPTEAVITIEHFKKAIKLVP
jgi:hypothetical protein